MIYNFLVSLVPSEVFTSVEKLFFCHMKSPCPLIWMSRLGLGGKGEGGGGVGGV